MTLKEFETLTNQAVTEKDFDEINEMYMNTDLDKQEFCQEWADNQYNLEDCAIIRNLSMTASFNEREYRRAEAHLKHLLDIMLASSDPATVEAAKDYIAKN